MQPDPVPDHPSPGMHIWGWMAPAELDWLHDTAATMGSVAEVGSLHGRSSFALLSGCPGPVYCIDPWDDPADESFASFMSSCGHFDNLHPVRGYSPAAVDQVPDVDMVFIDGAHDYAQVKADIEAWLPKTLKLICGHDYSHEGFGGVRQAVDEIFGDQVRPAIPRDRNYKRTSIWKVAIK